MNVYVLMKRIIEKGDYDKADMQEKLDTYFMLDRITKAQYIELNQMINPPVVEEENEENEIPAK